MASSPNPTNNMSFRTVRLVCNKGDTGSERNKGKLGAYAMKRVAAGAHLPNPWLFEPAKRPDDRADYCLGTRP